ncbi:hypothetical protein GCM10009865_05340 [Aeromicrobium ponti]|uniref:Uncharacterized protein n=1 Tax=Cytobacillus oceanisediminis TaxID=665099 RepID=A0A562K6C5_9BACI|nr:hypothetical protein [Cytobacillus oceanisediminis]TWH90991.1 hypothetical protein IQ19_00441 [Cytobacillus oceanisediminis]
MKKFFNFDLFQRVGKSFMVIISLLPAAGLLLGIGTTLEIFLITCLIRTYNIIYTQIKFLRS